MCIVGLKHASLIQINVMRYCDEVILEVTEMDLTGIDPKQRFSNDALSKENWQNSHGFLFYIWGGYDINTDTRKPVCWHVGNSVECSVNNLN